MPHLEQYLIQQITSLGQVRRFVIGYSGGVDSRVLLELFARLRSSITDVELVALHMNHGLQLASAHWSEHCAATCQGLGIPFHAIELQLTIPPGESTEAVARTARYAAFRTFMQQGDVLVLGHHQDDQVETLLLQLLRGAGPHGLAAMAEEKNFAPGKAIRPLLNIRRAEIESYARENALTWIEDPSNQSLQFDRNYLRHQLLPKLEQRWPSYRKTISRAAGHQANATKLLEDLARLDIQVCSPNFEHRLHLNEMKKLSIERQQNLVRYWIRSQGFSLPNQKMLVEILAIAQLEGADHEPSVQWAEVEVRKYQQYLYVMVPLSQPPNIPIDWTDIRAALHTGFAQHRLILRESIGDGLARHWFDLVSNHRIEVAYRLGGERCRFAGKSYSTSLKKHFQQQQIPPWERDRTPLLFIDGQLAAVVGHQYCVPFAATEEESSYSILLVEGN